MDGFDSTCLTVLDGFDKDFRKPPNQRNKQLLVSLRVWTLFLLRKSRSAVALFQAGFGPSAVAAKFVQRSAGS